jgi:hypothetical protein
VMKSFDNYNLVLFGQNFLGLLLSTW